MTKVTIQEMPKNRGVADFEDLLFGQYFLGDIIRYDCSYGTSYQDALCVKQSGARCYVVLEHCECSIKHCEFKNIRPVKSVEINYTL